MLQFAVRRFALPAVLLACGALMLNDAVDVWNGWRRTESLMMSAQREKAETAARGFASFDGELERQLRWIFSRPYTRQPTAEQRHYDFVHLMQQAPAVLQLTRLDGQGREQLSFFSPSSNGRSMAAPTARRTQPSSAPARMAATWDPSMPTSTAIPP